MGCAPPRGAAPTALLSDPPLLGRKKELADLLRLLSDGPEAVPAVELYRAGTGDEKTLYAELAGHCRELANLPGPITSLRQLPRR